MNDKQLKEAAQFSSFCQKFKMIVWGHPHECNMAEKTVEEIALELWDYLKKPLTNKQ